MRLASASAHQDYGLELPLQNIGLVVSNLPWNFSIVRREFKTLNCAYVPTKTRKLLALRIFQYFEITGPTHVPVEILQVRRAEGLSRQMNNSSLTTLWRLNDPTARMLIASPAAGWMSQPSKIALPALRKSFRNLNFMRQYATQLCQEHIAEYRRVLEEELDKAVEEQLYWWWLGTR